MPKISREKFEKNEEANRVADELDVLASLDVLADSEGGKILVKNLTKDIVTTVELLAAKFKTATHVELIAYCAAMKEKLDVLRSLTRSKRNKKFKREELEELLKEPLEE